MTSLVRAAQNQGNAPYSTGTDILVAVRPSSGLISQRDVSNADECPRQAKVHLSAAGLAMDRATTQRSTLDGFGSDKRRLL